MSEFRTIWSLLFPVTLRISISAMYTFSLARISPLLFIIDLQYTVSLYFEIREFTSPVFVLIIAVIVRKACNGAVISTINHSCSLVNLDPINTFRFQQTGPEAIIEHLLPVANVTSLRFEFLRSPERLCRRNGPI